MLYPPGLWLGVEECGLLLGLEMEGQPGGLGGRCVPLVRSATRSLGEPEDGQKVEMLMDENMLSSTKLP